ncbi:NADH:flavin oxidoreductase/NADH oxidase [soil metagenome]
MSKLFEPFSLRGVTFRNRVGVSPMCQYSVKGGLPTDWHMVHLGTRAVGGAGLIIAEASAVTPDGRISLADTGIWSQTHSDHWRPIVKFIAEHGAVPGIQLAHAGRKASTAVPWEGGGAVPPEHYGWQPIGPGDEAFSPTYPKPRGMTLDDIRDVRDAFVAAAHRAIDAGFRMIEVHAAHGYLLHSFYSPLSNHRTDEYGGSFANRVRLTLEVTEAVRREIGNEVPLFVRLSCSDWTEGGWTIEDSVELAKRLKAIGVDAIDCSSGGNVPSAKIAVGPGYQVPFAKAIRQQAEIPTAAVGMITEPKQAEAIIASGEADMVLLAREMLRDPYWPIHAARALGADVKGLAPIQYGRAL